MKFPSSRAYCKQWKIKDDIWTIKFKRKLSDYGECDPSLYEIRIRYGRREDMFRTFIHEMIHAIEFSYDFTLDSKAHTTEHPKVYKLEEAIARLLCENFE